MNFFSLSASILIFITSILVVIIFINSRSKLHYSWLFFNLSIILWGTGAYLIGMVHDNATAVLYWRFGLCGSILLSILFFNFASCFYRFPKVLSGIVYTIGIFFLLLDIFGREFYLSRVYKIFNILYAEATTLAFKISVFFWLGGILLGFLGINSYLFCHLRKEERVKVYNLNT